MNTPSDTQLAWFAGILDGEGSIHISRGKSKRKNKSLSYNLYVQVAMTHLPTVEVIQKMWGIGTIRMKPNKKSKSLVWLWAITGSRAALILRRISPFLVTKQEHARVGISFQRFKRKPYEGMFERLTQAELTKYEGFKQQLSQLCKPAISHQATFNLN